MKKKITVLLLLMAVLSLGLTGCGTSDSKNKNDQSANASSNKIIVGYWGGTCEAPIFIAHELGYFKKVGLDAQLLKITTDVAPLMANHELDAYQATPDQFKPIEQGLDLKLVDGVHIGCIQGAARPDSGIKTVADLEGKKVAAAVGSIAQIQISSQMVKLGKDPQKVNWVSYPLPQMETAMNKGEVDAFAAYDPFAEIAVQNGAVKFYSNTFDEGLAEFYCCFLGVNGTYLKKNPDNVKKLVEAFSMANAYLEEHPQEAAKLMIDKGYVAGTVELNGKLIDDYKWISGDQDLAYTSILEIWNQIDRAGALEKGVDKQALAKNMLVWLGDQKG